MSWSNVIIITFKMQNTKKKEEIVGVFLFIVWSTWHLLHFRLYTSFDMLIITSTCT